MDRKLFYFVLNRETDGTDIFSVTGAVVVVVTKVEAGPENPSLLCTSIETVPHAVAMHNINCVVVRVLLRMREYFVDRSEHVGLAVILEISRVGIDCIFSLSVRDE